MHPPPCMRPHLLSCYYFSSLSTVLLSSRGSETIDKWPYCSTLLSIHYQLLDSTSHKNCCSFINNSLGSCFSINYKIIIYTCDI
ncbi:hypothetical protein F4678DRAFT_444751 [Xylaria arbuscula]|nr:hypothetical protein F4678DRAFT_444751 [Xylaria arbuscula]